MSDKSTAVFGIYSTRADVEAAVDALKAQGFCSTDISVLANESVGSKEPGDAPDTPASQAGSPAAGAASAVGGALGWLSGVGGLAISGAMFMVAGPIMVAMAGMTEALVGIGDALMGLGMAEPDAKRYEGRLREGAILLSVHTDDLDWIKRGREIFERTGAEGISSISPQSA